MPHSDNARPAAPGPFQPLATSTPVHPDRAATQGPDFAQANAEHRYEVTRADLPLSCPMPGMSLWNSHPRVYLPIEATGEAACSYCGAHYLLRD